ncbi:universal stress protein [uncultured Roseibium sp.]|uniref:universal stress protein n=1 Tax=uncultured Roseibium sp. TaxID=1936171 RepID=UPI0032167DD6
MSFKTVLAVVDYRSDLPEGLQSSIRIARWFDAHLAVLLVGEVESLPFYGYGSVGYTEIWVKESEERAAALKQAAETVEALLAREGLSFEVRAHQTIVAREDNLVARHAIYADLTIMQRSGEDDLSTVERQVIDGALFDSGRPLLFLPAGKAPESIGTNVMIAWNSRAQAAEAVSDALPLLKAADKVTLIVIDPVTGPDDHGEVPGADMAVVLARHGVEVEVRSVASGDRPVSQVLQDEAVAFGADLVVMGAYGHMRIRENIIGGTTRDMLETSKVPLLLAH